MKAFIQILILLFLYHVPLYSSEIIIPAAISIKLKGPKPGTPKDIDEVMGFIREGNKRLMSNEAGIDRVKECIDSAIMICERKKLDFPAGLYLLEAEYFYAAGDLRSASEKATLALDAAEDSKNREALAKTYLFLGKYNRRTGFFKESIENYENAVAIADKESLRGIIPLAYMEQAALFRSVEDRNREIEFFERFIDASNSENDTSLAISGYLELGTRLCGDSSTVAWRDFRRADSLLRICHNLAAIKKDTLLCSWALANRGWNFYLEKMYDSSIYCYESSLKRYSIPGKKYSMASNALGNLGTVYRDLNKPEEAIKYYKKAIDNALKVNSLFNLQWIYMDMSDMYLKLRDTTNAYLSHVMFKKYSDAYNAVQSSQGMSDARIRYEADTRNKELQLLSLRLKNNRLLNYGFAGFIILTAVIGFLLLRGSKLKNKRRLSEMNSKISELTQANLRQQMNPHFIFNTLNSIQYYMYQHDKLATNNYLTKFSSLMRKVLDNSQHTSVPLSDELSALNLYMELESIRFKDKFDFRITIDDEIDPIMHKVPTMLIQPYVENSISHGLIPKEGKGFVSIDLKLNGTCILCTIEDNGIGREASMERNLKKEGNHNSLGTRISRSRLDLVNELYGTSLQTVYSDLKDEEGLPAGTRVEIHIPILS
ncbi:MAG: histidine kinase [Bacteroidales bacterium]|nr:histidine kinase [Bacteroidales bacterium]